VLNHQVDFTRWRALDLEPEGYRPESLTYASSVMELLSSSLTRVDSPSVLHFGSLKPGLLNLVQKVKGKLLTLDLDSPDGTIVLSALLRNDPSFDAILLWDDLFYGGEAQREALHELVEISTRKGSVMVVHTSARHSVPARSNKISFAEDFTVEITPSTTETRHSEILDLKREFVGWRAVRTTQLRNGFREHLLVRA